MAIEILNIELDYVNILLGMAVMSVLLMAITFLKPKRKRESHNFQSLKMELKKGHEGLKQANKSLQLLYGVLTDVENAKN